MCISPAHLIVYLRRVGPQSCAAAEGAKYTTVLCAVPVVQNVVLAIELDWIRPQHRH
jgi:hypothetical protein